MIARATRKLIADLTLNLENSFMAEMGRPKKVDFDDKLLSCIEALSKAGKTHDQIADILGIHRTTLYRYKAACDDFCYALNTGKEVATSVVEQSLFSRATGYTCDEVKVFFDPKSGQTYEHVTKKHYPPDSTAMIFWLKNCAPKDWRDKIEHTHGGGDNPINLAYNATQRLTPAKESEDDD